MIKLVRLLVIGLSQISAQGYAVPAPTPGTVSCSNGTMSYSIGTVQCNKKTYNAAACGKETYDGKCTCNQGCKPADTTSTTTKSCLWTSLGKNLPGQCSPPAAGNGTCQCIPQ
jgi:hypothetical protein